MSHRFYNTAQVQMSLLVTPNSRNHRGEQLAEIWPDSRTWQDILLICACSKPFSSQLEFEILNLPFLNWFLLPNLRQPNLIVPQTVFGPVPGHSLEF